MANNNDRKQGFGQMEDDQEVDQNRKSSGNRSSSTPNRQDSKTPQAPQRGSGSQKSGQTKDK